MTVSQSAARLSGFNQKTRLLRMIRVTANTCATILIFPSSEASIVNPCLAAMLRRPVMASSRPTMITTIQAGAQPSSTSEMKAAEISNLSAIGSRSMPSVVT